MGRRHKQRQAVKTAKKTDQSGFTLVEILVALILVTIVFLSLPLAPPDGGRKALERTLDNLDRAVRFAQNESILRNTVVRLVIKLDKRPQEYYVQYGPAQKIKIPSFEDLEDLSLSEREIYDAKMEKFNRQFATVSEFKDQPTSPEPNIIIAALGTSLSPTAFTEGQASMFFYPSGERDDTLIILSSDNEMASLEITSFNERTTDQYYAIEGVEQMDDDQFADAVESKMKEIYEKWTK
jgi:prepilin-type N-terminal cleavage/methylation domain-containing protein